MQQVVLNLSWGKTSATEATEGSGEEAVTLSERFVWCDREDAGREGMSGVGGLSVGKELAECEICVECEGVAGVRG